MEEQMKLEMQALIEKHLPAQMGASLKKVLEQGQKDANKVLEYSLKIESLEKTILELRQRVSEKSTLDVLSGKLANMESALKDWELRLKTDTLAYQLQAEKDKTKFAQDVAMGLVRNTEYRKMTFDNKNTPYTDQYGSKQTMLTTDNSNTSETAE